MEENRAGIEVHEIMSALSGQARSFLESEAGIEVYGVCFNHSPVSRLKLSYLTSVLSINTCINMFLAFSFEKELIYSILGTYAMDLDYHEGEEDIYLEETASEMSNIVAGNSTAVFLPKEHPVSISPPIVITEAKSILSHNQARFYSMEIQTSKGALFTYLVGPKHLFDSQLNYREEAGMPPLSVMVVDDSLIAARKLTRTLEDLGHKVAAVCRTGEEACRKYEDSRPDLVMMDITMPDMDGIEATRSILSSDPGALIIMVTSQGHEQMVINSVEAGTKGYILKPFKQDKISETIEKIRKKYSQ